MEDLQLNSHNFRFQLPYIGRKHDTLLHILLEDGFGLVTQ